MNAVSRRSIARILCVAFAMAIPLLDHLIWTSSLTPFSNIARRDLTKGRLAWMSLIDTRRRWGVL
jgi:hypothetical protein